MSNINDYNLSILVVDQILTDEDSWVRENAVYGITELVKRLNDPSVTSSWIEKLSTLLTDEDIGVRKNAVEGITEVVKSLNDPSVISSCIEKLSTLLTDEGSWVRKKAVKGITGLVKSLNDPSVASSWIEKLSTLLTYEDNRVRKKAVEGITELVKSLNDPSVTNNWIEKLSTLLTDEDSWVRKKAVKGITELVKSLNDPSVTSSWIEKLNTLLTNEESGVRDKAVEGIAQIMTNLLLPKEEFTVYLNHSHKEVREQIVNTLSNLFKDLLKFELLEKLLEDQQNLNIEIINKELFDNKLNQVLQDRIAEKLRNLAKSDDQNTKKVLLADIKSIILSRLNKIENVKDHKLIELALLVIGKDALSTEDTGRKELSNLAIGIITYQIEHLSSEGLKWVNDNFEDLVSLSRESKWFVKILYHKVLEDLVNLKDSDSINLAKELIIKSINQGMTTSITKTGEIIFEGKKYVLENKDIIEEIARVVIDQDQDVLAKQYIEHKPLLPKSGSDLDKAAVDVNANSIVDNEIEVSHSDWRLSLMHLSDHKKSLPTEVFLLLEGRSAFGDLVVYKIPSKSLNQLECFTKHPSSIDSEFCKSIFGAMEHTQDSKPRYYASSFKINYHQVKDLLEKVNNGASLEGASDVITVRESLITLLQDIISKIDADTLNSLSKEWSEYVNQDQNSVRTLKKYELLKLGKDLELQDKRFKEIETKTQELSKKVDDNNAMTEEEKTKSKEMINKISNSLKKITTKVDAHDPILQEMIGKVQELSDAHESNVTNFMDICSKVYDLEDRFTKIESMTQALNEKVDDNNAMTEEEKTKSKEMINKISDALEKISIRVDVHDPILENITTQLNGLLDSRVFTMTNLDELMTVLGNCGYQPWHY